MDHLKASLISLLTPSYCDYYMNHVEGVFTFAVDSGLLGFLSGWYWRASWVVQHCINNNMFNEYLFERISLILGGF